MLCEKTHSCYEYVCSISRSIKIGIFAFFATVSLILSLFFAGATLAYRVNYNGHTIATVLNPANYDNATLMVARSVHMSQGEIRQITEKPVFTSAFVFNDEIDSDEDVANAIIENTDNIVSGTAITVNGNIIARTEKVDVTALLESARVRFDFDGNCMSDFVDDVATVDGFYLANEIVSEEEIVSIINSLSVETVYTVSTDTETSYKTTTIKNSSMERGTSSVITQGQKGLIRKSETVTYVNGSEITRTVNSQEVVREPIDRVVEIGTAKRVISGAKTVSGLNFPLPSGVWQVSAYYGDGRNHQAIDLRAPSGTSIYAVSSGTVVSAGWDGNYGKSIVIDHGNGIKTRYAHEKDIFVSVGDTVSAGEVIGTVGKTGNATGNHLHFEIIINGTRIDPAPSLGI